MVDASFSYPKERIAHSVYLMLTLAGVVAIYHNVFPLKNTPVLRSPRKQRFLATITIGILVLSTGWTGYRLRSELELKKALEAWEAKDWQSVITYIDEAESLFYNMDPMATPIAWYKGVAYFNLGSHEEALNNFEKAYRIHPYHIHVLNNLASSYELSGHHQHAIAYYKQALAISPHFEEALLNLGIVYYNLGQFEEAKNVLSEYDNNSNNPQLQQLRTLLRDKMEQP